LVADLAEISTAATPDGVAAGSPAIHTVELSKRFGDTVALAGLSMIVPRGEVFGFLGPNGAGKTTSVKLLLGLIAPSSGEGWLLGQPIGDLKTRRRIGYLPELFRYQSWLSAREVLAVHCELAPLPRSSWNDEITTALDTVGLTDRAADRVGTFSKGMQQRLGIAQALVGSPRLLLLDEPTSALDPVGRRIVRGLLEELRRRGVAVLLNSHLLSEVERVCDRVAIIARGKLIKAGTPEELAGRGGVEVETDSGVLTFEGAQRADAPEIVAELIAAGERIYRVEVRHPSLEDVYLEAVGGQTG
jgi:ABC-type multidrug transport system, ATPase component